VLFLKVRFHQLAMHIFKKKKCKKLSVFLEFLIAKF